ncbi:MAG: alpha/beta fold hydrolase [Anaerolineales bacterium]|nr:alpha/beta fold hydrolase [Anaerolineales bacterium]
MKRALKGLKRRAIQLDFNLYRIEVPIEGISDSRLSVVDIWPENGLNTMMFIHGYAGCAETWEYQINHFSRSNHVIAPDLRGHGQSDAPFTQYTMEELVDDINTIAEKLSLPEKFILVGHSFGGAICLEYANAHPERLEKLILIATAGEYPLPRITSWVSRIPTVAFRPWWRFRPRWNAEVHVMKRMLLNNMRHWKGWSLLENIRIPTLVITGERDRYFPGRAYEGVVERVPDAQAVNIGASKHKVQLERHKAVNRAIERFIYDEPKRPRLTWRDQTTRATIAQDRPWLRSYGKHSPHSFAIPRQPLHRFLEASAGMVPKRTATVFYGAKLTYQQLERRVNQFAHALHGLGVQPGDRVMVVLPNMPQMIIAYYGILKIGGVVVLSNPDADASKILHQLRETESKVLVTLEAFAGMAKAMQDHVPVKIIYADIRNAVSRITYKRLLARWAESGFQPKDEFEISGGYHMESLMMDASRDPPDIKVSPSDLAAILYTSGTTDDPKGVCLTHTNLVANALQTRHWIPDLHTGKETFLSVIPLTHSYGMTTAMNIPIAMGATIVLLSVFELDQVFAHIKQHKPTIFPGVPTIYLAINQAPDVRSFKLSSIKACVSGAAPLPIEVQEKFEKLSKANVVEGYGLTEASPVTHVNPFDESEKVGTIGIPIPNTDAKIVDLLTGEELPPGKIGELVIKGPQVMKGYWTKGGIDESETRSVLKDEWLFTGDVAVMDSDGFFSIISRKRDTIMAGEYSVYPRDVEEVLYENSKVLEAAVIGVEGGERGQKVKAFVVPRPGTGLSKEELIELCRQRLETYAVPWEIEFRKELPKSFVGKVLRRTLVEESMQVH